jgi:hypothetical protein
LRWRSQCGRWFSSDHLGLPSAHATFEEPVNGNDESFGD